MFNHIKDDRLRAVLESDIVTPAEFDWAMQYTRDCIMADDTNVDVPDHVQQCRWEHYDAADDFTEPCDNALRHLRTVWLV
jgi:hypothetical protein